MLGYVFMFFQAHADTRMPFLEQAKRKGVVTEQEVLHRMWLVAGVSLAGGEGILLSPLQMCDLRPLPFCGRDGSLGNCGIHAGQTITMASKRQNFPCAAGWVALIIPPRTEWCDSFQSRDGAAR